MIGGPFRVQTLIGDSPPEPRGHATPATVIRPAAVAPMVGGPFVLARVLLLRPAIGLFPPLLGLSL